MSKRKLIACLIVAMTPFAGASLASAVEEAAKTDDKTVVHKEMASKEINKPIILNEHLGAGANELKLPVIPTKEQIRKEVIDEATNDLMPLNANQIHRLKMRLDAGREAAQEPVRGTVKLMHETMPIEVGDTKSPKTIYLSSGKVSSFTFLDIKGKPWPITDVVVGQKGVISVSRPKSHIAFVSTLKFYGDFNLAFMMEGIDVPVYFHIKFNMEKAHESVKVAIQNVGPTSEEETIVTETNVKLVRDSMYGFLDELPAVTGKSEVLDVKGYHNSAWYHGGKMYVRVPSGEMISPAYDSYISSGTGVKVYKMDYTPILMFSDNGKIYNASIKRPSSIDTAGVE